MFHEDAFYFWNAQNSVTFSRNLSVGFERGDDTIFCNHEKKLHARWHGEVSQEEFLQQCSFQYKIVDSILQENAPFNPFVLARKNCVERALCPADQQPPEENECHTCFERNVVFGEDVKMFTSYLSGIDNPKSHETVNIFCNAEAILHSNWVIGGDLDGFLSACHRDYLRIINHNDGPLDICPFGFAHKSCANTCGDNKHQGMNQHDEEKFMKKKHHMMQKESHHERRQNKASSSTGPDNVHQVNHHPYRPTQRPTHRPTHGGFRPHAPQTPQTPQGQNAGPNGAQSSISNAGPNVAQTAIDIHGPVPQTTIPINPQVGTVSQQPHGRPNGPNGAHKTNPHAVPHVNHRPTRPFRPNTNGGQIQNVPVPNGVQTPIPNANGVQTAISNAGPNGAQTAISNAGPNGAQTASPIIESNVAGPINPQTGRPNHRPNHGRPTHGHPNVNHHKTRPHNNAPQIPNQQMNAGPAQVASVVPPVVQPVVQPEGHAQ